MLLSNNDAACAFTVTVTSLTEIEMEEIELVIF
jgi:hypothetical protein